MKVLVLGSGGREHALSKALLEDKDLNKLYSLPGKPSLKDSEDLPSSLLTNREELVRVLKKEGVDLVVVGPEKYLVEGLGDYLRKQGFQVFGPSGEAAKLEGSKIFAKKFMKDMSIPTASFRILSSVKECEEVADNFTPPYVFKADGLAGGKGVFILKDKKELLEKARFLFEEKGLGEAGREAILEDFQSGFEISVLVLTNGKSYSMLPIAQDYKRLHNNQEGPNTGGMGAVAPIPIEEDLKEKIKTSIIEPTLKGLGEKNMDYCGVIYFGLMVSKGNPKVLEYNVRFGDPEAQVLLPLLDGSWLKAFYDISQGKDVNLKWKNLSSACVVLCSKNYPAGPNKEVPISGDFLKENPDSWFIHAGIKKKEQKWVTSGGRIFQCHSFREE